MKFIGVYVIYKFIKIIRMNFHVMTSLSLQLLLVTAAIFLSPCANAQISSLQEAFSYAHQNNPQIKAERSALKALDAEIVISQSKKRPKANLSIGYNEFLKNSVNNFTSPDRALQIQAEITLPLYDGGRSSLSTKVVRNNIDAGRSKLKSLEGLLYEKIINIYMEVVRNQALLSLAKSNVEMMEETLNSRKKHEELGFLGQSEVLESELLLVEAKRELEVMRNKLNQSLIEFHHIVGQPAMELDIPETPPEFEIDVIEAKAIVLENNSDILEASHVVSSLENQNLIAKRNYRPTVDGFLNASHSNYFNTLGGLISTEFEQRETLFTTGVRVNIPLYEGGRLKAENQRQNAKLSQAKQNLAWVKQQTTHELDLFFKQYNNSKKAIELANEAVSISRKKLEFLKAEERAGLRTSLEILRSQKQLAETQLRKRDLQIEALQSYYRILNIMGALAP